MRNGLSPDRAVLFPHRGTRWTSLLFSSVFCGLVFSVPSVHAQEASNQVTAPAGAGQRALTVGVLGTPQGVRIHARTCATSDCPMTGAQPLPVQPSNEAVLAQVRLRTLGIGAGRHVVHVQAGSGTSRWQAFVGAPMGKGTEPIVIWSGSTPEAPIEKSEAVQIASTRAGISQVLVGRQDPNLELCGRPTLLSPRVLYTDLTLRPVKAQRLPASERQNAERITATRSSREARPLGQLLVGIGASSGYGSPGALTDGNPDTFWSEGRSAEGRGEFVVMRAPSEVPIPSISFVIRPPTTQVEQGASPKSFYLAADDRLIRITLPEDGWKQPGARYQVDFDNPIETSCLAVVLDDAFLPARGKDARVTLSEVTAYSALDGTHTHESLVELLGEEDQQARVAAAILLRSGLVGAEAVAAKIGKLNESGRHLALQVLDAAPCPISSPVFASMLASPVDSERIHAEGRIRRCGRASADALEEVITHGVGCTPSYRDDALCEKTTSTRKRYEMDPGRLAAANELASIAPEQIVPLVTPLLGESNRPTRRALRQYLSRATTKTRGRAALFTQLLDDSLSVPATVDLLRAVKDDMEGLRGPAGVAFGRVAQPNANLRTRYLLLEPAAKLAAVSDGRALFFLRTSIATDPEPMVRTQAVMTAQGIPAVRPWLLRALEDENVRVRKAAAMSLAGEGQATPYLIRRLMLDDWPMVRVAAARALATAGPSPDADRELGNRLKDPSPSVRQWAATSLGARGVTEHAKTLRSMADNPREKVTVRIAVVHALGRICDLESVDFLTLFATRSANPYSPEASSGLGAASIAALGRIHPADLRSKLDALLSKEGVPLHIKAAAEAALTGEDRCPVQRAE